MQAWYLNENPYPFVPAEVLAAADSVRGSLPNRHCDPKIAADLFEESLDEYLLCDDIGINVVSNEHHSGINCLFGASPLILGILARQTRRVRILSLGTLITVREDPVRVAEEYATADVISRGRLEIGFVKSGGTEMASGNMNPVGNIERFWEAIDLILKSLSHHDGPFSWEGKHYTHRHVNIWPPPWQQPYPPLWAATGDPETSAELGRRGMINVLVFRGPEETKRAWTAYRKAREEARLPEPRPDRFGYAAFVYTGETDEEGMRVGEKLLWFLNTGLRSAPQYSKFLPGSTAPRLAPSLYRSVAPPGAPLRPAAALVGLNAEQAIARGLMFAGNPDTVHRQILEFQAKAGKFEHLVLASRSGFMTHEEATRGLKLFAKEVLPRFR
jgi:alkanesulfonate monooxygenase SsuD/methylene tetrahydromethanopterin reductase-like flavin-dependent oxidoreductase (luciferase family)